MKTKRRTFIKNCGLGTAGIAIGGMGFSNKSYMSIPGANERIVIAVIGLGGRGLAHVETWGTLKDSRNVTIKTLCDADEQFFNNSIKIAATSTGMKPSTVWDMRKIFDDREIDAVSIATPNYWHALGTIRACQAGKHVYVEKPVSWCIHEGRKMVEASKKYNVRVQVGTQGRSDSKTIEAIKFLNSGGIGNIYKARALCIKPRDSFGISGNSTPPSTLHYDNWLGPVAYRPYNEKKGHYNWHWFWETGNGETGNTGPHMLDIAKWGMNKNEHPKTVYSMGDFFGIDPTECAQETPNTQLSVFKYNDGKILEIDVRGRYSNAETNSIKVGNIFYGTEGYLELPLFGDWKAFRGWEKEPFAGSKPSGPQKEITLTGTIATEHFSNFLDAIRSGKDEDLNANITDGHYAASLAHMANISYRLGRELEFDGTKEKFVNDPEADAMLIRKEYRKPYDFPEKV